MPRRDLIHDKEPWLQLLWAPWFTAFGGYFFAKGDLTWIVMLIVAMLWGALAVWGLRWRWKADIKWAQIQPSSIGWTIPIEKEQP